MVSVKLVVACGPVAPGAQREGRHRRAGVPHALKLETNPMPWLKPLYFHIE